MQDVAQLKHHLAQLAAGRLPEAVRQQHQQQIARQTLVASKYMSGPNFEAVSALDLRRMVQLYDQTFFEGVCFRLVAPNQIRFRWSRRMTSAGGKTTRTVWRPTAAHPHGRVDYEIALSVPLIMQDFQQASRPMRVCGQLCHSRMAAMQRIVEHELLHWVEMLVWSTSNCAASRFQSMAANLFGHAEHRHEMITPRERAARQFKIQTGSRVEFRHEAHLYRGVVNRITRRATVLVEAPTGQLYSDGRRYVKFYVPLEQLRRIPHEQP
jgi:hypothetical protein